MIIAEIAQAHDGSFEIANSLSIQSPALALTP